jgi:hypothetical protein
MDLDEDDIMYAFFEDSGEMSEEEFQAGPKPKAMVKRKEKAAMVSHELTVVADETKVRREKRIAKSAGKKRGRKSPGQHLSPPEEPAHQQTVADVREEETVSKSKIPEQLHLDTSHEELVPPKKKRKLLSKSAPIPKDSPDSSVDSTQFLQSEAANSISQAGCPPSDSPRSDFDTSASVPSPSASSSPVEIRRGSHVLLTQSDVRNIDIAEVLFRAGVVSEETAVNQERLLELLGSAFPHIVFSTTRLRHCAKGGFVKRKLADASAKDSPSCFWSAIKQTKDAPLPRSHPQALSGASNSQIIDVTTKKSKTHVKPSRGDNAAIDPNMLGSLSALTKNADCDDLLIDAMSDLGATSDTDAIPAYAIFEHIAQSRINRACSLPSLLQSPSHVEAYLNMRCMALDVSALRFHCAVDSTPASSNATSGPSPDDDCSRSLAPVLRFYCTERHDKTKRPTVEQLSPADMVISTESVRKLLPFPNKESWMTYQATLKQTFTDCMSRVSAGLLRFSATGKVEVDVSDLSDFSAILNDVRKGLSEAGFSVEVRHSVAGGPPSSLVVS